MKTSCVITGASGFIGKNLMSYLDQNQSNYKTITRSELKNIKSDDLDGCTAVIHLAGKAHDLKGDADSSEYYDVNMQLTKNIYDAFIASTAEKFIFMSSVKAAADHVEGILTEDAVPNPQTHYGKSKLMAENYIKSCPLPAGKSYYILRPCIVYGPYNKGNLNLLFKFIKSGFPYPLASFNNKRSFLSVHNLGFVINEILQREDIPTGIYQVSDSESLSTTQVVSILSQSISKRPFLWKIPRKAISILAKIGDVFNLPLNTERLIKQTESYVVSNAKIISALKKPLPISSRDGLTMAGKALNNVDSEVL